MNRVRFWTLLNKKSTYKKIVSALFYGAEGQNRTADTGIFSNRLRVS